MSSTLTVNAVNVVDSHFRICASIPGPFTFRIMLLLVSSMNSTLTCVTPPREPSGQPSSANPSRIRCALHYELTGSSEDSDDFDKLNWLFSGGVHLEKILYRTWGSGSRGDIEGGFRELCLSFGCRRRCNLSVRSLVG